MQLNEKEKFGNYEIIKHLASGAYGDVYQAQRQADGKMGALKIMLGSEPEASERFRQEMKLLSQLQHRNIVEVYEMQPEGTAPQHKPWYVMELLRGPTLKRVMEREIPLYRRIEVLQELASALGYMHLNGYRHLDVKPENIMMREPGDKYTPVLFDLGLAHNPQSSLTIGMQPLGTPRYLSPEQIEGVRERAESDVWALGVIMYEWLTGSYPFGSGGQLELMRAISEKEVVAPVKMGVDEYLSEMCMRMLGKRVEERYGNGKELENAFWEWREHGYRRCLKRAAAQEKQGAVAAAIATLEEGYLWHAGGEAVERLRRLWKEKMQLPELCIYRAEEVDAAAARAQARGEELRQYQSREITNPEISARRYAYVVCSKITLPPPGWPAELWKECWDVQGELVDFTTPGWRERSHHEHWQLSAAYQQWYAQRLGEVEPRKVERGQFGGGESVLELMLIPPGRFMMGSPAK